MSRYVGVCGVLGELGQHTVPAYRFLGGNSGAPPPFLGGMDLLLGQGLILAPWARVKNSSVSFLTSGA